MTAANKDVIYIDIDDEITSIIDKVRSSEHRIVALVLPKRASMLQSSVNMKLLKRAADDAKKHIVLITSEAGLLPLASAVGLHVAKTLQSKPAVPKLTEEQADLSNEDILATEDEAGADEEFDTHAVADKPIGELAGLAVGAAAVAEDEDETIELDDVADEKTAEAAVATKDKKAGTDKKKVSKKLKVPNFEKFRLRLIIGAVLLLLLIGAWIVANIVLPKATITIATNNTSVNTDLTVTLDSGAKALDATKLVVPAQLQQVKKTTSQQVPTTGQKNEGTKASGSVVFYNCDFNDAGTAQSQTIPAGTGISSNGLTFITQTTVIVPPSNFKSDKTTCKKNSPSSSVNVVAQSPGSQYNVGASNFAVSYNNPTDGTNSFSAQSTDSMSGGTDSIIKVVAQGDIDSAKQKLTSLDNAAIQTELQNDLQAASKYPVPVTFNAGSPTVTTNANVGDQTDTLIVTQTITYTMFGVKQSDLQALLDSDVNKQIDTTKQAILDDGFSKLSFTLLSQTGTAAQITAKTSATAGQHLDVNSLKQQVAGKKSGDVQTIIGGNPGVTGVTVHYSPFWVSSTPKKLSKITIIFQQASSNASSKP